MFQPKLNNGVIMKLYSSHTSKGRTSAWTAKYADNQKPQAKSCKAKARQEARRICMEAM